MAIVRGMARILEVGWCLKSVGSIPASGRMVGNPEVVRGSFVPASGSRPDHEYHGMSRALAVEMRADIKASVAARM